jgi:hypothetical protein
VDTASAGALGEAGGHALLRPQEGCSATAAGAAAAAPDSRGSRHYGGLLGHTYCTGKWALKGSRGWPALLQFMRPMC